MTPYAATQAEPAMHPTPALRESDSGDAAVQARLAQPTWASTPLRQRLAVIRRLRHLLVERMDGIVPSLSLPQREQGTEALMEVLCLADACRFLEREAPALLAPRRLGAWGRPLWLGRVRTLLLHEPVGVVLIIAAGNYPLMLPGVQLVQALAAGNAVILKPGRRGYAAALAMRDLLVEAGLPQGLLSVLPETEDAARGAMASGVDKVLLTGSATTGRQVLGELAERLVPATLELSGCCPVFVLEDADLDQVAAALRFGLTYNGGATCIAPRRVFVPRALGGALEQRVAVVLSGEPAIAVEPAVARSLEELVGDALAKGARLVCGALPVRSRMPPLVVADATPRMALMNADVMGPVLAIAPVTGVDEAIEADRNCPYALAAAIFGSRARAMALADRLRGGVVTINDLVVPTADPRLPFGGRDASGYGVTRGGEGLLELTRAKAITVTAGRFRPHFQPAQPQDPVLFRHYIAASHSASPWTRLRHAVALVRGLVRRGKP